MSGYQYHVFLSHSSSDKEAVEELALWLVRNGVTPFLDKWELVPGEDWTDALSVALSRCATCAVIIGPGVEGGWQIEEVKQSLIRRVRERKRVARERFRIIPVLLPGASPPGQDEPSALGFLSNLTWIKFEKTLDEEAPRQRLICGIRGVPPGPTADGAMADGECPYRGLGVFDVAHARLFFGREKLTRDLVWMLGAILRDPGPRLLAVVGPSGSGKSSIVRAGLIPVLEQGALEGSGTWRRLIFKPGRDPFENLGIALATLPAGSGLLAETRDVLNIARFGIDHDRSLHTAARLALRNDPPPTRLIVLVDQFEEIFTQCRSEEDRTRFLSNLIEAATVTDGPVLVILAVRADFLGMCASYRGLSDVLSGRQKLIGEMLDDELRWAVEKPAALAGGEIEAGLVEQLLLDVGREPGSLPLLEFALGELWRQKTGRRMTIQDYHELGGLQGALRTHAEAVLDGLKKRGLEDACRRIFLGLIEPGKGTVDTRRRVAYQNLAVSGDWTAVVESLVHERLLTSDQPDDVNEGTIEIVHESLIKYWPTLQDWVNTSRELMEVRSEMENAANNWNKYRRDTDSLLRGLPLANALEWARTNPDDLVRLASIQEFLDASQAAEADREQDELRQERRLREEAEAALSYQKKLRLGSLITFAAVLILVALLVWIEVAGRRVVAEKRVKGLKSVFDARLAISQGNWPAAKLHLTSALALIDREASLAGDASEARRLLVGVDHRLGEIKAREAARARWARFDDGRDQVLFLATLSLDADSAILRERAVRAAREAFASVGLTLDGRERPDDDPSWAREESDSIRSGGYEVLLVLANALSQPLSRQPFEDHRSRVGEAMRLLDRAAALRTPTRTYHLQRARCLAFLGDQAASRQQAERAETLPPIGAVEHFLAGVDLLIIDKGTSERDAQARATRCFEQALRSQPNHFWARYYLAICSLNTNRPDLATVYLDDCLLRRPGFVWIYLLRGLANGQRREFVAGLADFQQALELDPDEDARYALFVNRAELWLAQRRRDEAVADLKRAIALKPDRYQAHRMLALLSIGDRLDDEIASPRDPLLVEAASHLDTAIRLKPTEPVLTNLVVDQARLFLIMKRPKEALDACNLLLKTNPDAVAVLGVRAAALLDLGNHFPESDREFTRYLELGGVPRAGIYRGRGHARMKIGNFPGAVDDYSEALRLNPDWVIRMHRGWAHFFADAYQLAIRDFEEALRLEPSSVESLIGRGLARVALERDLDAIKDASEAAKAPPDDADMTFNIACIFGRAASRQDPGGPNRRQAIQVLGTILKRLPPEARRSYWDEKVLNEPYLDAIKQDPAFLRLGERLEPDQTDAPP